jgi:hypothetical protein
MQHSPMANVAVSLDDRILSWKAMHTAAILKVATLSHNDSAHVTAKRSVRSYIATWPYNHVANQYSARMNIGALRNYRSYAVDRIDTGH